MAVSELWGEGGERWTPQSRLPDFSHAGYRCGDGSIPDVPVATSVLEHGAKGDGKTDDTKAILAAVRSTERGAVLFPEGRYVLTDRIRITKPRVVLRGAGADRTILDIPKSLVQITPIEAKPDQGVAKLSYSFGGAFVEVTGGDSGSRIGAVAAEASRGDVVLRCPGAGSLRAGDWVRLTMNNAADLGRHIHAGQETGEDTFHRGQFVDWVARVTRVDGEDVEVDRPLRVDVRAEWQPELHTFAPTVDEVGVEGLTFEFPGVEKKKHLLEEGFNSIHFRGAVNSWVRDIRVIDGDMGVKLDARSRFCQVEDTEYIAANREGLTGHHAIWASGNAQECLSQRFRVETTYVHDLTVEGFAHGNVFRDGGGVSVNLDHHRNAPYENLFTNMDVGDASRLWRSSGRGDRGPHSGARTTLWNIRHNGALQDAPGEDHFPQANIVGVSGYVDRESENGILITCSSGVVPEDLFTAQVERRHNGARD